MHRQPVSDRPLHTVSGQQFRFEIILIEISLNSILVISIHMWRLLGGELLILNEFKLSL